MTNYTGDAFTTKDWMPFYPTSADHPTVGYLPTLRDLPTKAGGLHNANRCREIQNAEYGSGNIQAKVFHLVLRPFWDGLKTTSLNTPQREKTQKPPTPPEEKTAKNTNTPSGKTKSTKTPGGIPFPKSKTIAYPSTTPGGNSFEASRSSQLHTEPTIRDPRSV